MYIYIYIYIYINIYIYIYIYNAPYIMLLNFVKLSTLEEGSHKQG